MRKSEEYWGIFGEFTGIEGYTGADKGDDDLGGNTTKPPPTKP